MKNKRILLVEDKYEDVIAIQNSLKAISGQTTLHVVHNVNDALQVLMGGSSHYGMENYSQTGKVRPDIVLLNISFFQESAREFLEVMQKYYSLKNIKVYITGDSNEALDPQLALKYGIAGYLVKPIDLENTLNDSVMNLRMDLQRPGRALFSLGFLAAFNNKFINAISLIKTKCAYYYLGSTIATKVTVSLAATVLAAGVVSSSTFEKNTETVDQGIRPAYHSNVYPTPEPVQECTEQEAILAAESVGLPDLREKRAYVPQRKAEPKETAVDPRPQKQDTQGVLKQRDPRQFKIVAREIDEE